MLEIIKFDFDNLSTTTTQYPISWTQFVFHKYNK